MELLSAARGEKMKKCLLVEGLGTCMDALYYNSIDNSSCYICFSKIVKGDVIYCLMNEKCHMCCFHKYMDNIIEKEMSLKNFTGISLDCNKCCGKIKESDWIIVTKDYDFEHELC
jgi:hypothetical protein